MDSYDVPDRVGEVVGWRAWQMIEDPGKSGRLVLLASVTHRSTIWHPDRWTLATCGGELECRKGERRIPGEDCSCGLYAAVSRQQLVGLRYNRGTDDRPVFIGEVAFAGKVIPGRQGWRAEKGRIHRLYVPHTLWRYVDPLEELYNVEVVLDNTLQAGRR